MEKIITCPITRELFSDPVIAPDGQTYERFAIDEWLRVNKRSPLTNLYMERNLIPNITVRQMVSEYIASKNKKKSIKNKKIVSLPNFSENTFYQLLKQNT